MKYLQIVLTAVCASVVYGIIHDQITVRICIEYFTVAHPPIFGTEDPTLLGLGWGIIATRWVGALLGLMLAMAARYGRWPKVEPLELDVPLVQLLACTSVFATLCGLAGYLAAVSHWVSVPTYLADLIPRENHVWFLVDACIHGGSYLAGAGGAVILVIIVVRRRYLRGLHASTWQR